MEQRSLQFTVDAHLLRELGQRLVGKPHIALAELVKNGYDADASQVSIEFDPKNDRIVVQDDGHGMTFDEFKGFWMRVGTTHKEGRVTRQYGRAMTGSKGVGRLSAQFLAGRLEIVTVPPDGDWLSAYVDWEEAIEAESLTEAKVFYALHKGRKPYPHGTKLILSGLRELWDDPAAVQALAGELWSLQPPFRGSLGTKKGADPGFHIEFVSSQRAYEHTFDTQMRAILGIWSARLVGKNEMGRVKLSLEFPGEAPRAIEYSIGDLPHNRTSDSEPSYDPEENLNHGEFEIRIFSLKYRQPHGISVEEARTYLAEYGGVHVYDGGFRLPYYGSPKNDWLAIEYEHSHRRTLSRLLPADLQDAYLETERLGHLPTLGRVYGVVRVDTSQEPNLDIMITRDRLAESKAFQDLVDMVRYAFHFYAYERARQYFDEKHKTEDLPKLIEGVAQMSEVLQHAKDEIPESVYRRLDDTLKRTETALSEERENVLGQVALLGPLATAGIATLALQHEMHKQLARVGEIAEQLSGLSEETKITRKQLRSLGDDLQAWVKRATGTYEVFSYLLDAGNVKTRERYEARAVVTAIVEQLGPLARGVVVDMSDVELKLLLPKASFAEWGAVLQNVIINAMNAMLDSDTRVLRIATRRSDTQRELLIEDTGVGVDLADSERLFEPFERGHGISAQRMALGYGGSGLGLTIVRLLTGRAGCEASFVSPGEGFNTAFSIAWEE